MEKILVANRGEIASRIIRTCRRMGIATVAVYSEADRDLPFVKEADEAVCIGKPHPKQSYINMENIIGVAKRFKVDGIHPGYGFLSEDGTFARRVEEAGLQFIGPKPETLFFMGDKLSARRIMKKAGVPVLPGTDGEVTDVDHAVEEAGKIGYPVMLKAAGGGGGIGMVLCRSPEEIKQAFSSIQTRAKAYFNSDKILVEKYLENPRHIEVQIVADSFGNTVHLFERNCSVQRRNQKVVEETPSPHLGKETKDKMYEAAIRAAEAVSYTGAGTVEFIVDYDERFYFLEMNTRLQVEHPITEATTGIDLVEWQIRTALGEPLPLKQGEISRRGHSMEFRLYAEHPETFYPSPGKLKTLSWGTVEGVRIDSGYSEGNEITPFYDPLIAKCIFFGKTREDCLKDAAEFFRTTEISGIHTNIPFFLRLLENKDFLMGDYSTKLVEQLVKKQ